MFDFNTIVTLLVLLWIIIGFMSGKWSMGTVAMTGLIILEVKFSCHRTIIPSFVRWTEHVGKFCNSLYCFASMRRILLRGLRFISSRHSP